jgi:hypothetical protein
VIGQKPDGLFIVGCHRSGTTLLRYLLDAHPELACPPESKFISALYALAQDRQAVMGLHSLGLSDQHIRALLRHMVHDALTFYATQRGKPRWVDKTPNYAMILPFIDGLFEQRARYVIVVRHPFDCVLSLEEFFQHATVLHEDPDIRFVVVNYGKDLCGWAKYWRDVNERLLAFVGENHQRCRIVKYEELAREPENRVSEILDFIAVDRVPGDASRMSAEAFKACQTGGYQDDKIQSTDCVHEQSINKWADWDASRKETYWLIVGRVAEAFGYSRE